MRKHQYSDRLLLKPTKKYIKHIPTAAASTCPLLKIPVFLSVGILEKTDRFSHGNYLLF